MGKVCVGCKEEKELSEFTKNRRRKDGFCGYCKPCHNALSKKSYYKHKDSLYASNREWYQKKSQEEPEYCKQLRLRRRGVMRTVVGRVRSLLVSAKSRSRLWEVPFDLDEGWLLELFQKQNNRCSLTGLEFDFNVETKFKRGGSPLTPSLDRIDSTKGYTKDNTRLVCFLMNLGINCYGLDNFEKVCLAYIKHNKLEVSSVTTV